MSFLITCHKIAETQKGKKGSSRELEEEIKKPKTLRRHFLREELAKMQIKKDPCIVEQDVEE